MKLALMVLFSAVVPLFAGNVVVTYEPAVVELTGKLDLQTFPGPPNYESIRNGDEIERHFYLRLDAPVDVLPRGEHPTIDNPEPERNVRVMQLVVGYSENELFKHLRKIGEGGRVRILGTLFHRFTGHHHSRILLKVQKLEEVR